MKFPWTPKHRYLVVWRSWVNGDWRVQQFGSLKKAKAYMEYARKYEQVDAAIYRRHTTE